MRNNMSDANFYDCVGYRQAVPIYTIGATGQLIPNHGKILLTATGTGTFHLQAPEPGVRVTLIKTVSSTGIITVTSTSTGTLFNYSSNTNLTFDAQAEMVELEAQTTSRWDIIANVGSVGVS